MGDFQQYVNVVVFIVCIQDGFVLVFFIDWRICKGVGILVGGKENVFLGIGVELGNDIGGLQYFVGVGFGFKVLFYDFCVEVF